MRHYFLYQGYIHASTTIPSHVTRNIHAEKNSAVFAFAVKTWHSIWKELHNMEVNEQGVY